ncbi:MAG: glycine cleavage system aminomethyltransferase GcvT [Akkermansia sp.]
MNDESIKSTPLAPKHVALGAKMVPFAGWNMPVQYTGIMDEHKTVRTSCGVFDISHMGQFFVSGKEASAWLNTQLSNDIRLLDIGHGQYTIMLNEQAGVIDDLIIYRYGQDQFFVVVNASKIDEDFAWLSKNKPAGVILENHSDDYVGLAIQGPTCGEVFAKILPGASLPERNGIARLDVDGQDIWICRTGYTGEDGFEFFCPADHGIAWLEKVIASGAKPCGLGARDSLRLEMCYPLNGSDLSPNHTPIEAGLGFFCKLDTEFTGVAILREQKANGPKVKLVAIEYTDKGAPPRSHYPVFLRDGAQISELSSGVLSPSLMKGIGMGYVPSEFSKPGTELEIEIRGKKFPAIIVKKPFYKKA